MKVPTYGLWLVAAMGACACAHASSPRSATLATLREEIQAARRGGTVDPIAALPPLDALIGAHRAELGASLGTPRICVFPVEAPCESAGEIVWSIHRDAEHGPQLVVRVDARQKVIAAQWRAVGGPAPALERVSIVGRD